MKHCILPVFLLIIISVSSVSCEKTEADKTNMYEEWQVHDYCEAHMPSVICHQDDRYNTILCCDEVGKHREGEKIILSQKQDITYYRVYEKLLKKY